ncbi:MAG: aldehyde dehydrogenase family protein, partial [Gemmatimonadota bacterium]|nr:aldehyde dehydrogenase family protein [Gemmatimonadota bacterium]
MNTNAALLRHFINNCWEDAQCDGWLDDVNPSNRDDIVARIPRASAADARSAASSASIALPAWRALPGPSRAEYLHRWAGVIGGRAEELAQVMAREVGKPIGEARGEVGRCIVILRYYAGEAVREMGQVIPAQSPGALQFSLREPLGVVALITPWNFPLAIPLWKAAPALAFGNTVVLKPAEASSLLATMLASTALEAGLPAGVFNVVLGEGSVVGSALVQADDVRAVSFTGSGAVGSQVARLAASRNIRYQTEMGGKNVVIVMPDADIARAAALTAAGAMRYAGQKCTATSRVIVARKVESEFLDALRSQVEALPLGPVTDLASAVGPLISAASRDSIQMALRDASAETIFSCPIPDSSDFSHGNFLAPTVVRGGNPDGLLAQRELFGPVLAAFTADDLDHAIELANSTSYGLSASIFTSDIGAALRYLG